MKNKWEIESLPETTPGRAFTVALNITVINFKLGTPARAKEMGIGGVIQLFLLRRFVDIVKNKRGNRILTGGNSGKTFTAFLNMA